MGLFVKSWAPTIFYWLFCIQYHSFLSTCCAYYEIEFKIERRATYFSSLRAKLVLASIGIPKWVWLSTNQCRKFVVQTTTLSPSMHQKLLYAKQPTPNQKSRLNEVEDKLWSIQKNKQIRTCVWFDAISNTRVSTWTVALKLALLVCWPVWPPPPPPPGPPAWLMPPPSTGTSTLYIDAAAEGKTTNDSSIALPPWDSFTFAAGWWWWAPALGVAPEVVQ